MADLNKKESLVKRLNFYLTKFLFRKKVIEKEMKFLDSELEEIKKEQEINKTRQNLNNLK